MQNIPNELLIELLSHCGMGIQVEEKDSHYEVTLKKPILFKDSDNEPFLILRPGKVQNLEMSGGINVVSSDITVDIKEPREIHLPEPYHREFVNFL